MIWWLRMAQVAKYGAEKPWYRRGAEKWHYFRDVPWSRLWVFLTAVFFLFSVIGYFEDLVNGATAPIAVMGVVAFMSGLNALVWVLIIARFSRWVLGVLIPAQFLLGPVTGHLVNWMQAAFHLQPVTPNVGMRVAASGILVAVIVSYFFFVWFFRVEGVETAKIRNELQLAHGIQKTLVPPVTLRTARWEVYGVSRPSEKVGGDLVDALRLEDGDTVAYVADIAGHGLSAGILMGMLKTAARTVLLERDGLESSVTLPKLLDRLNRVLPAVKEPQMYATFTAFRLNEDGSVWYSMAASPPILHWSAAVPRRLEEEQFPLGLLPVARFRGDRMEVAPGDVLAVATDGILEVCDQAEQEYGIERLEAGMMRDPGRPLEAIAESILADVGRFGRQADDQTLLLIRRVT